MPAQQLGKAQYKYKLLDHTRPHAENIGQITPIHITNNSLVIVETPLGFHSALRPRRTRGENIDKGLLDISEVIAQTDFYVQNTMHECGRWGRNISMYRWLGAHRNYISCDKKYHMHATQTKVKIDPRALS